MLLIFCICRRLRFTVRSMCAPLYRYWSIMRGMKSYMCVVRTDEVEGGTVVLSEANAWDAWDGDCWCVMCRASVPWWM